MSHRSKILFVLLSGLLIITAHKQVKDPIAYEFPVPKYFPAMPYNQQNPVTVEGVELGRHLFYDPILSYDSSISCASCHRQEVAFSDAPNRFSHGINNSRMRRNTLPLFNLSWYPVMFWDGKAASIEEQALHPLNAVGEMNLDWLEATNRIKNNRFYREKFHNAFGNVEIDSILIINAIAQFERTLISHNSKYDRVLRGEDRFNKDEQEGFVLVNEQHKGNCLHCHTTDANALGTTGAFSNNGLDAITEPLLYVDKGRGEVTGNKGDFGQFRIPSLRNVEITPPYMHDGRFFTLEEVLDFYSNGVHNAANIDPRMAFPGKGGVGLTQEEQRKVISFLKTLTDSVFIANPDYSKPTRGN